MPDPTPFATLQGLSAVGDEEFLYHLYRGSDLLQDGRISEAKEALEKALEFQPKDVKGQDLLAVVYFRLGVYDRAVEIYRRLVLEHPREPVLRVNLAVVYLKTGQFEEALTELRQAVEIQPDHVRAQSYLGLVHERLGDAARAREAYLRAGLVHMARRMGAVIEEGRSPDEVDRDRRRKKDVSSVADQAFQEIDSEENPFLVEAEQAAVPTPTPWHAVEPGGAVAGATARPDAVRVPALAREPVPAGDVRDLARAADAPLAVDAAGALVVCLQGVVYSRLTPLTLYEGMLEFEPVHRRSKGRDREEPFGEGDGTLHLVRGNGRLVLAAAGARHFVVRLEDDVSYFREELVAAFTSDLQWENGRIATPDAGTLHLVSFRGRGSLALRVSGEVRRIAVRPEGVTATPSAIVGWTGRLLPRSVPIPGGDVPALLHLAGEGALLVLLE